ncbi:flagellar hook-associated protein FlgK [Niveibacterium terrae]|uniref:flagellar hook-associated protein FlgK n=1 Tax=Niveibacterium terrae TaxID=3373598 RepID=UPI003A933B3A
MGNSILSVGITGLSAAQAGLITTSHNIANASTDGYSRQSIVQTTNTPMFSGVGYFGQGTTLSTVKRSYDDFLNTQVMTADARYQELDTYYTQIKQVDDLFGDSTAGLSPALQGFFTGVQKVAAGTDVIPSRESMLSGASVLQSRFKSLDSRLNELRDLVGNDIKSSVTEINSLAKQVGELNQRIIYAANIGSGQPPNDLLDQRDELVSKLNEQVQVSTQANNDGSINVFIGNGQPLVIGSVTSELTADTSKDDISRVAVGIKLPSGQQLELSEAGFSGGKLSGLLSFRSQTLDPTQNALGRIALSITETFNAQHKLGQDLDGNLGKDFFTPLKGTTIYPNSPANAGDATIDVGITSASDLTTSDYSLSYTAANTFQLVRRSDGQVWTGSGANPTSALASVMSAAGNQGFSLTMTATSLSVGDHFTIEPTRTASAQFSVAITDPRQIAAAAPIRTTATSGNTGTGKIDAGSVQNTTNIATLQAGVTLTYAAGSPGTVSGFPAGFPITVTSPTGVVTSYAAGSTIPYSDGSKLSFAGATVTLSGAPKDGDTFSIGANPKGVADSRNAVLLGALQTEKTMIGDGASYSSAYAQLVASIGAKTREMEVTSTSQKNVLEQTQTAKDSVSGVNLDEEASNLIRYQQAYQASGKVMEVASKLFDQILAIASAA